MCQYTYEIYRCGHGYSLIEDTIEYCSNRTLSAYSVEAWTADMCTNQSVTCSGFGDELCDECESDSDEEYILIEALV